MNRRPFASGRNQMPVALKSEALKAKQAALESAFWTPTETKLSPEAEAVMEAQLARLAALGLSR